MAQNLYDEALADAKKIREVAEESAKQKILESVTPKIREFIESQILEKNENIDEENIDEENIDEDEIVELDESAVNSLVGLLSEGETTTLKNQKEMRNIVSQASDKMSDVDRAKLNEIAKKFSATNDSLKTRSIYNNNEENITMPNQNEKYYEIDLNMLREAIEEELPPEEDEPMPMEDREDVDMAGDDMVSKDELERQIKELIDDMDLDIGGDLGGEMELGAADDMEMDDMEMDDMEMDDDEEDEVEQLDEVFEVDPVLLRQELRRIKSRVSEAKGQALAHQGGIASDHEHHFGGKGSANSKGGDFGGGKPGKDVLSEMRRALRNQRRENSSLENKLTKYRSAVNTLREQLEELNLFNAKLLYVNKLLQNKQISESQKRSIVQALDEAKDLREAKVLYKSLTESFQAKPAKGKSTLTESVRLGGSSRTTRSASASTQVSSEVNRWARLAGLK